MALRMSAGTSRCDGGQKTISRGASYRYRPIRDRTVRPRGSPRSAMLLPLALPRPRRSAKMSIDTWVGCSFQPSPALITGFLELAAMRSAAPFSRCRTTMAGSHKREMTARNASPVERPQRRSVCCIVGPVAQCPRAKMSGPISGFLPRPVPSCPFFNDS